MRHKFLAHFVVIIDTDDSSNEKLDVLSRKSEKNCIIWILG